MSGLVNFLKKDLEIMYDELENLHENSRDRDSRKVINSLLDKVIYWDSHVNKLEETT